MIAPHSNAEFVADMEKVLELYRKPYDSRFPVVCFDEMPRQLIGEFRPGEPMMPGYAERIDYEYVRNGTCNILMATEPLRGWRMAEVTETKTAKDWALFTEKIIEAYPEAEKIILVEDNLSTHKAASWYSAFPPEKAKRLMDRVEFVYTPKHGSWLNIAEIELNVLSGQCLKRRIPLSKSCAMKLPHGKRHGTAKHELWIGNLQQKMHGSNSKDYIRSLYNFVT